MSIIALSVGELDNATSASVAQAGVKAITDHFTHYGPVEGTFELRDAIAKHYQETQSNVGPENILVTSGVRQAVHNVLQCLIERDDEVILPAPYWFAFPDLIELAGAKTVILPTTEAEGWSLDLKALREAITPKTKLFIFNNPANPTGKVFSEEEINALVSLIQEFPNLYVLSDEIYEFITFDKHRTISLSSFDVIINRVITVSGFSKAFAMAGWRVGYIIASEILIQQCRRYQEISLSGVSPFTQKAALEALQTKESYLPKLLKELTERREMVANYLAEMPALSAVMPEGAYYFFINISGVLGKTTEKGKVIQTASDFCTYLLTQFHLQVFNGENFGMENYVRLSFSVERQLLHQGLERLKNAVSLLR